MREKTTRIHETRIQEYKNTRVQENKNTYIVLYNNMYDRTEKLNEIKLRN